MVYTLVSSSVRFSLWLSVTQSSVGFSLWLSVTQSNVRFFLYSFWLITTPSWAHNFNTPERLFMGACNKLDIEQGWYANTA